MNRKVFNAIGDFVADLYQIYDHNKPLALYNRLLEKTPIKDEERVNKHIEIFSEYLKRHRSNLLSGDLSQLDRINYNLEKGIYIDMPLFIKKADKEISTAIKNHLVTIALILHPDEQLDKTLKEINKPNLLGFAEGPEGNFMESMMGMMSGMGGTGDMSNGQGGPNIMQMAMGLMGSMQSGEMNPKQLFGGIKQMMAGLEKMIEESEDKTTTADLPSQIVEDDPKDENIETPNKK